MKKFFSLFAAVLFAGSMMAESITITPANFKSTYGDGTFTLSEVEFAYSGAMYNGKNSPTGFASKQLIQLRKSGSGAGEIKNNGALNLKSIVIATQNDKAFTLSVGTAANDLSTASDPVKTSGKYACKDNNDGDKEADVTIYTFDVEGNKYFDLLNGSAAQYIAYITIELGSGETPVVAKPTISGEAEFENEVEVTISAAAGAAIYYTLDGTDPTDASTEYTAAFTLNATTTVKAIAKVGENVSAVASKTFTKVAPAPKLSLTEFITNKPTTAATLKDLTVIFADNKSTYVIDEEGVALVMYDNAKTYYDGTLTAGKVLSGQKATYTVYNNQDEIVPTNAVVATDGVAPVPTLMNAAPTVANVNQYVAFKNVAATLNDSKYYIFDEAVLLYGATGSLKPTAAGNYDMAGIIINYKGNQLELIVLSIAPATPTALDNAAVEGKAVKFIENGQLFIEKAGVRYNVMGQIIK